MATFSEEAGSPREEWSWERGLIARRTLRCTWSERFTVMEDLALNAYPYRGDALYAISMNVEPAPGAQSAGPDALQIASYEDALITAQYGVPHMDEIVPPEGTEFATESFSSAGEFTTLDPSHFSWGISRDPLTAQEAPGKLVKTWEYEYIRRGVAIVPVAVLDLVSHVNDRDVHLVSPGLHNLEFAAETLLYQPPHMTRRIMSTGASYWDLQFRFLYKPNLTQAGNTVGWNWFWHGSTQDYEQIVDAQGTVVKPYPVGNFSLIRM